MALYVFSIPRFLPGPWAVGKNIPGPPPVQCCGEFVGCPRPGLPPVRVAVDVFRTMAIRLGVTPVIVARPWYIVPSFNRGSVFNYR